VDNVKRYCAAGVGQVVIGTRDVSVNTDAAGHVRFGRIRGDWRVIVAAADEDAEN